MQKLRRNTSDLFSKFFNNLSAKISPEKKLSTLKFHSFQNIEVTSSRNRKKFLGYIPTRVDFQAVAKKIDNGSYKITETVISRHGYISVSNSYIKQEKLISKNDKKLFSFNEAADVIKELEDGYQKNSSSIPNDIQPLSAYHYKKVLNSDSF